MFLQGPITQQRGPWDSPRKNPGENTVFQDGKKIYKLNNL